MIRAQLKRAGGLSLDNRNPAAKAARLLRRRLVPKHRRFSAMWSQINQIEGFLVPGQEWWLYNMAYKLEDDAVIVEIGSFKGRSTSCLALGCIGTSKHVYAIDTFNGNDVDFPNRNFMDEFRKNLNQLGVTRYVTPMVGASVDVAREWHKPIDFIFIDGSHHYDDVVADFENFYPYVKSGGIIALHDITPTWPGPTDCWKNVAAPRLRECAFCSTIGFGKKP